MEDINRKIEELLQRLEILSKRQQAFNQEIFELRREIFLLRQKSREKGKNKTTVDRGEAASSETGITGGSVSSEPLKPDQSKTSIPFSETIRSDVEKFIGENLINKIGIVITIIGVAIGTKYSIEHELISPLGRIILGYLLGIGLLGFGIKLRQNYKNYSAVLVSGAIAIFYFITYAAYTFYNLVPQGLSFAMMTLFTIFGVVTSFSYDLQVIAHIGLVGAYAVPFLVGGRSGNAAVLFGYVALIDFGILIISVKKYWKALYYSSFVFTWLIFAFWFFPKYKAADHFSMALFFISVFFLTFYLIFLDYKLRRKEKFDTGDLLLLIFNSFLFFAFGYFILKSRVAGEQLLGLFALLNAAVHFVAGWIIYRQKLVDKNLFYFVAGLVLVFITIAIPIQLNGSWVTLLWSGEAALLFWIGRGKRIWIYEKLSYPLIFLAFISLVQDWLFLYNSYNPEVPATRIIPLWNFHFLTSALFVASALFINYIHRRNPFVATTGTLKEMKSFIDFALPALLLISLYFAFNMEISTYWNQLFRDSFIEVRDGKQVNNYWNNDLYSLKYIWSINYSLLFFALLSFVNNSRIKSNNLGWVFIGFRVFVIIVFLTRGLFVLGELRESYLRGKLNEFYPPNSFHVSIRYISYLLTGLSLYSLHRSIKQDFLEKSGLEIKSAFDILLAVSGIGILSSEWINLTDIYGFSESYRLGLSILWGVSSLVLIIVGIWKRKSHLRIGAIVLFGITLLKLFFYDLSHLDTIAKTIVFVSLGILLLVISFLYNKYRHLINSGI